MSNRDKIVMALIGTTRPQIQGHIIDADGGACAIGVLAEALAGYELDKHVRESPGYATMYAQEALMPYLRLEQSQEIGYRNDGTQGYDPHTFDEIAKVIKDWPADS